MLCPNCGEQNALTAVKCAKCGYILQETEDELNLEEATIHFKPIKVPQNDDRHVAEDAVPYKDEIPSIAIEDKTAVPYLNEKKRKSNSIITIIIWVLLLSLVVTGLVFGINWISKLVNPSTGDLFQPKTTDPPITTPKISVQTDENGEQYIYAEFYGSVGDSIYISATDHYYEFEQSTLKLLLYKKDLFETTHVFDQPTETVYLSPSYVSGGEKHAIEVSPLTLDIDTAEFNMPELEGDTLEVFQDSYNIKLQVSPEGSVTINELNLTERIDRFGQLIYAVNISPDTVNPFEITVTEPYTIPVTRNITITRAPMPVTLTLDKSSPTKVSSDTVTLTGTTEQNVQISSNQPIVSQQFNALYNSFTITLKLDKYGTYPIELTATSDTKGVSKLVYSVLYWPDEDVYTRKARVYESMLSTNPSAYKGIIFLFKEVTVQEVLSGNPTTFTVNMGTTEAPEMLLFEYQGTKTIQAGDTIKIFADVEGPEGDMAKLNARFIY